MHQVGFSLHDYIEMHGQQNIKEIMNSKYYIYWIASYIIPIV